jgi:hypothetical protein
MTASNYEKGDDCGCEQGPWCVGASGRNMSPRHGQLLGC